MPFAGYKDFAACVAANSDKDDPEAYCATIQRKVEKRQLVAAGIAKHAVHNQKDHGNRDGATAVLEPDDELSVAERFGEYLYDDYGEFRDLDDPDIVFFETGGVSFYEGDLPTTPEAREIVNQSSAVEGYWASYGGAEAVRMSAAEFTGTEAWEGQFDQYAGLRDPSLAVGWDEALGVSVYGPVASNEQIAYTYLYDLHHQTGRGLLAEEDLFRGVGPQFPDVQVGDSLEFGLASFSPDPGTAYNFGDTIIILEKGAKIRETHDPIFEVLTGGSFEVTEVDNRDTVRFNGRVVDRTIWVRQTATYDPDTGELS